MFLLSLFFFVGVMVFWSFAWLGWSGSFYFLGYLWGDFPFCFMLDCVSLVCVYMLVCCGFIALFYCYHYFSSDVSGVCLFFLMCWFLFVMLFLMVSQSVVFSLVMWEYLGLVSFFLILFYSNMVSLRASLVTLFASRFGDVSLFVLILWALSLWDMSSGLVVLLLFMVVLTKSACYPFISWLIEAMRAPTPVSSLVHSSTLVAAGVWFLLRYDYWFGDVSLSGLLLVCLITIFISGVCASCFSDLKKIVALSTCNNVSWCIVFFICGDVGLSLLQLLTHGVCKCYLFMSVGDVMSSSLGAQDSKSVYVCRYIGFYPVLMQFVLVFSLCGLPFLGVFFGKHGLLSLVFYSCGGGFLFVLLFCFFLSYVYSFRFYLMLVGDALGMFCGYLSSFYLVFGLVLLSTLLNYLGSFVFILESVSLGVLQSWLFLCIQLLGGAVGFYLWGGLQDKFSLVWSSSLWGSDFFVSLFYRCFSSFTDFFVLGLYRWEVFVFGLLHRKFSGVCFMVLSDFFFSLNVLVCALLLVVLFSLFLF